MSDFDHAQAREETGFWGRMGAGSLIMSRVTGRFLVQLRGDTVEEPNTWGTWGGAVDEGNSPEQGALNEFEEETGKSSNVVREIVPVYVYKHPSGFEYHNFVITVDDEFTPRPGRDSEWEINGFKWVKFGQFPKPLHFGLKKLLQHAGDKLKEIVDKNSRGETITKQKLNEVHDVSGRVLINVDIQPEYEKSFGFKTYQWIEFLNQTHDSVNQLVFLYNGNDTMGMVSEEGYKDWLLEKGLDINVLDQSRFYDKGYAFFRYCMDSGVNEDATVNFVRFMYQNDIRDSRDMTREMWSKYLREYRRLDRAEVYELLKKSSDCVHIPDLMDFLKKYNNIVVTGGGINECLKEVEIALNALKKSYSVLTEFTY